MLASGVRAAVKAWGLQPCAKEPKWYSDTVTAVVVPPGFNGADVINAAFRRYNLSLGAGLSQVAGKVFRIGHLGDLNELMVLGAISGVEMAMRDVGIGIAARQRSRRRARRISVRPSWPRKRSRRTRSISPRCTQKASSTTKALRRASRAPRVRAVLPPARGRRSQAACRARPRRSGRVEPER